MDLTADVRTAVRMTTRNPGTSALIVFTLALAIGAATIAFAFADLALLRGLPVDDPSRVVSTFLSDTRGSEGRGRVAGADFLDYRTRAKSLTRVSVFREGSAALITGGQSRTLRVSYATGDLLAAMGQGAIKGRTLQSGDDRPGARPVVMLSHRYWQEEYGGGDAALGATMQIGRDVFTVVGVLTPEMEFGNLAEIDVWLPLVVAPDAPRGVRNLRLVARLADGVAFETAAAELATIGDALAAEYPVTNAGWKVRLVPIRELTGGDGFWVFAAGGVRGSTGSTRGRGALVVAQVALAVVLLTASSLALRSITKLYSSPTGMATEPVLIFGLNFNDALYPTAD